VEILNRLKLLREQLLKEFENKKLEDIHLNQKVITFLICLAVSSFLWLIQSLSKNQTIRVFYPVEYHGLPDNKLITNELPKNIEIEINTNGIKYFVYKISTSNRTINIDVSKLKYSSLKNSYYFLTNSATENIASQFSNGIEVLKVHPDTIFFSFTKKISKSVPVSSETDIQFEEHYKAVNKLSLNPSHVTISGPKEQIEKIKLIHTEKLTASNVKQSINTKLQVLKPNDYPNIEITPNEVSANLKVDKFTEGSLELELEFRNLPRKQSIKTFPDKVTVKYTVAVENYNKIKPDAFKAVIDYDNYTKGSKKLKVELKKYPKEISNPKLFPDKVEFIIRK
jgi:YbbR domain-containing protein